MSSWKGKTRGGLFGYKIFVFILKHFGLSTAYVVLRFVAAYFVVFAPRATTSIYKYYRGIVGYGKWKSAVSVYQGFFIFGQTLLDKVAIGAGLKESFHYSFDGNEHLDKLIDTGGIVFSAHLGNWEVAGYLLKKSKLTTNILMFEAEHERIKEFLQEVMTEHNLNVIPIKQDMSHIFQINTALKNKEVLCVHGDRFIKGSRILPKGFMGKKAFFPIGPFSIATKLKMPYTMAYAVRGKKKEYFLSATPIETAAGTPEELLDRYVDHLEGKLRAHPLQWFNFYDFWSPSGHGAAVA